MYKTYITIFCALTLLLTACSKDKVPAGLANGSVTFDLSPDRDTIQTPLSILADSVMIINFKASLIGGSSASDHWVDFAVDTAKAAAYRARYGAAMVLPSTSYYFYKPQTRIAAGAAISEPAQLNIVLQTKLSEYTTYVLPIVIHSVDGNEDGPSAAKVLYYVFRTGRPLVISKTGWSIAGVSSVFNSFAAANVIDDNKTATYWTSNITQSMPQWIAINFNRSITFSSLSYSVPTLLNYPALGGYPTSIKIETSTDGTSWVENGIYSGNITNNTQTINTGLITGRYLRFTSLASVKYASVYSAIFISDISLIP